MDGRMDGWVDGWMDEWMDGWMEGWVDGWVDGWMGGGMAWLTSGSGPGMFSSQSTDFCPCLPRGRGHSSHWVGTCHRCGLQLLPEQPLLTRPQTHLPWLIGSLPAL